MATMTPSEWARTMARRSVEVRLALELDARLLAEEVTALSKRLLQAQVYDVPEKRDPNTGRWLWRRSGDLMEAERWVVIGMDVEHRNDVHYSIYRYRYGTPAGYYPANPPQRVSHWYTEALLLMGPMIGRRRAAVVREALRRA